MPRIKAGDPANSYLLHRIDGDACTLAGCTSAACSELMPQGGPRSPRPKRLTIRGWIAQGALSDVPDAARSTPGATTPAAARRRRAATERDAARA